MARYILVFALFLGNVEANGQPSPLKAAALSLLVPGLGHRYVHQGQWNSTATALVLSEAGLWLGAVGSQWQRGHAVQSYRTYAATFAGAELQGKDRRFLVAVGSYNSSDDYRDEQLRQRRWDLVGYVSDPAFTWHWRSEADRITYQDLRGAADTWRQRRTVFIALLAANRVVAALSALRSAQRRRGPIAHVSFAMAEHSPVPVVRISARW